jgi:hypothetical protein
MLALFFSTSTGELVDVGSQPESSRPVTIGRIQSAFMSIDMQVIVVNCSGFMDNHTIN